MPREGCSDFKRSKSPSYAFRILESIARIFRNIRRYNFQSYTGLIFLAETMRPYVLKDEVVSACILESAQNKKIKRIG